MLPPEKQAEQFNRELDRYLFIEPDHPQEIPPEDKPELDLSAQLLQVDFSRHTDLHSRLRRHLENEQGTQPTNASLRLLQSAASRRRRSSLGRWYYLPALLALVIFVSVWSWTASNSSTATNAFSLHPSPVIVVTAILSASQQPAEADLRPVPTPLAPPSTGSYHPVNTLPVAQHTPYGQLSNSPQVTHP